MGPPKGLSALARSTSTWIHWWSPVASANWFTCSWVTSCQSLLPSSVPTSPGTSAMVVVVVMRVGPPVRAWAVPATYVHERVATRGAARPHGPDSRHSLTLPIPGGQSQSVDDPSLRARGCADRVHWAGARLDRRLDDLRPGPPPLGPGRGRRHPPAPRRHPGSRGAPAAPRLLVAPRRHLGDAGRCAAPRRIGRRRRAAGGARGARAAPARRGPRRAVGRRPRRLGVHDRAGRPRAADRGRRPAAGRRERRRGVGADRAAGRRRPAPRARRVAGPAAAAAGGGAAVVPHVGHEVAERG